MHWRVFKSRRTSLERTYACMLFFCYPWFLFSPNHIVLGISHSTYFDKNEYIASLGFVFIYQPLAKFLVCSVYSCTVQITQISHNHDEAIGQITREIYTVISHLNDNGTRCMWDGRNFDNIPCRVWSRRFSFSANRLISVKQKAQRPLWWSIIIHPSQNSCWEFHSVGLVSEFEIFKWYTLLSLHGSVKLGVNSNCNARASVCVNYNIHSSYYSCGVYVITRNVYGR
jgi:hypothetical protein